MLAPSICVIANILKRLLFNVNDEVQSGSIKNRLITDNVIISFEVFHWIQKQRSGGDKMMAIKIYKSKAYDRVEWDFLEQMLYQLHFPSHFTSLIMLCVKSISFQVLVNCSPSDDSK